MKSNYDVKNNILYLPEKEIQKTIQASMKTRGFIATTVDTPEEAQMIGRGENIKHNISPVLGPNEQAVFEQLTSLGKIVVSIVPLELLEMQVNLLYELAKTNNMEISREDLFKINKIAN